MEKKDLTIQTTDSIKPIEEQWLNGLNALSDEELQQIAGGGIIVGLGLIGANGQNNEDASSSSNVISGGDQQLSGQEIDINAGLSVTPPPPSFLFGS